MPGHHILELSKFVWVTKIVQTIFAVLLLALAAYQLSVVTWSGDGMLLWASLYSLIALTYFFISNYFVKRIYHWIILLVLESLSVLWWLVSWAILAALLHGAVFGSGSGSRYSWYPGNTWTNPWDADNDPWNDYYKAKRNVVKRGSHDTFGSTVIGSLALALINWILHCVTLTFMILAVIRHRNADLTVNSSGARAKEATLMESSKPSQTV